MQLLFSKNNRKTSSKKKKIGWVKGADCVRRRSPEIGADTKKVEVALAKASATEGGD